MKKRQLFYCGTVLLLTLSLLFQSFSISYNSFATSSMLTHDENQDDGTYYSDTSEVRRTFEDKLSYLTFGGGLGYKAN